MPDPILDSQSPTPLKWAGYDIDPKRKLSREQKQMAELMHLGHTRKDLCLKFGIPFTKLTAWTKNPRFLRYIKHLDHDANAAMGQKARALMDQAFKTLEKMLKSGHFPSEQFAVETVFRLNHRDPAIGPGFTNGSAVNVHLTQNTVDLGSLDAVKKEKVKELLSLTRQASPALSQPEKGF